MNDNSQEDFSTFEYLLGRAKSALPLSGGSLAVDRSATTAGPSCVNNKSLVENPFSASGGGKGGVPLVSICLLYPGFFYVLVHCFAKLSVSAECSATDVRPLSSA